MTGVPPHVNPTLQPTCAQCSASLPWADVDRGAGQCRQCGAAFEFRAAPVQFTAAADAPATGPLPTALAGGFAGAPLMPVSTAMFAVSESPFGVSVRREGGASSLGYRENARPATTKLEIRHRALGARALIWFGVTAVWTMIVVATIVFADHAGKIIVLHAAVMCLLWSLCVRQLRNGFRLRLDDGVIKTDQTTSNERGREEIVVASHVTSFFCEPGTILLGYANGAPLRRSVHHVGATVADGRVLRLLIDIERPEVAFYVAQLLARELGVPTR